MSLIVSIFFINKIRLIVKEGVDEAFLLLLIVMLAVNESSDSNYLEILTFKCWSGFL